VGVGLRFKAVKEVADGGISRDARMGWMGWQSRIINLMGGNTEERFASARSCMSFRTKASHLGPDWWDVARARAAISQNDALPEVAWC